MFGGHTQSPTAESATSETQAQSGFVWSSRQYEPSGMAAIDAADDGGVWVVHSPQSGQNVTTSGHGPLPVETFTLPQASASPSCAADISAHRAATFAGGVTLTQRLGMSMAFLMHDRLMA